MANNLVESKHGTGGIYSPKDQSVKLLKDIAMDTKPFDWPTGYDITKRIAHELTTKDQGTAGSCGGEATSYFMEVVSALNSGKYQEQSAKFIYAPCAVPGGGSSEEALTNRLVNAGSAAEVLCPSYNKGKPPTEAFMARTADITQAAIVDAEGKKVKERVYVQRNLESLAKAVRDYGGVIIGYQGMNNGTWQSKFPKAPTGPVTADFWAHWMYIGKALQIDKVSYVGEKQSWGDSVGEKGWQYLNDAHMPYIWTAFTYVDLDPQPHFKHRFNVQMKLGDSGLEVVALQDALKEAQCFPTTQLSTGYFGLATLQAVKAFQAKYSSDILKPAGLSVPTGIVAKYTLNKLNELFAV